MFQEVKSLPENATVVLKEEMKTQFTFDRTSLETDTALSKVFGSSKVMVGNESLESPFVRVDA